MTNYGDDDDLEELYSGLEGEVSADLQALVMNLADGWVDRQITVNELDPSTADKGIAANYYAMVLLLRKMYDTDSEESKTISFYMEAAEEALGISSGSDDDGTRKNFYGNPYASSKTPSQSTMDLRTQIRKKPLRYNGDNPEDYGYDY